MFTRRNAIFHFFYQYCFKPIAFLCDPEIVHDVISFVGRVLGSTWIIRKGIEKLFSFQNSYLSQTILGIHFRNPVGLSAGFDKDGLLTDIIPSIGFGFMEIGTITGEPCSGNPKPRLWRLIKSKSLLVYYGLKNRGVEEIARRLRKKNFSIPVGTNIGKTNSRKVVSLEEEIRDYVKVFSYIKDIGSYFTINLSCPNLYGGQPFTNPINVDLLLQALDTIPTKKPIFLKISPDLSEKELDQTIAIVKKHRVHGFVCSNLTMQRRNTSIKDTGFPKEGGMSGKIVEELANKQIAYIYNKTKGKYIIIGVGGIFTGEDAYKKIRLGANLVELITGMIFEGPQQIGKINYDLLKLMKKDGFTHISQAVGKDTR